MRIRVALAALCLLVATAAAARADERILRFVGDVAIGRDSGLDVVETLDLLTDGTSIRHGINRDFPTDYTDTHGGHVSVGFSVQSVTRDGQPEPFVTEIIQNGRRVRIGDPAVNIAPGSHEYVIRYHATRQIGFFSDYDELYWNVTGNGWAFPIDRAEARVTLPDTVPFSRAMFYTCPQGAKGRDAEITSRAKGEISFRTTRTLDIGEGLTIAVAWNKGVVISPNASQRASWWIEDNLGAILSVLATAGVLFFFLRAYDKVGRDPRHGTIIPLFSPPDDLSAAATRYIAEMDFDERVFSAAILDLGVRGHLTLSDAGRRLRVEQKAGGRRLDAAESAAAAMLFRDGPSADLVQANHSRFGAARSVLRRQLAATYAGSIFHWNSGWLAAGVAITVAAYILAGIGFLVALGPDRGGAVMAGLAFSAVPSVVVGFTIRANHKGNQFARLFAWLFTLVFSAGFLLSGLSTFVTATHSPLDYFGLLLPLVAVPVMVSAFTWMRSPTPRGQALRDQIAGFKQYLGTAEEHRLEILHPPEKTPELFERYLPYAVALDVENRWAARFTDILAASGAAAAVSGWYIASSQQSPSSLVGRLGADLSAAAASAATAPGSSSGSGGGGSSGGGGGGGGGSGW